MKPELREVLEKTVDWLESLAKLTTTTLDDQAVVVLKAILDSHLLSSWLADQVYSTDSPMDSYNTLGDSQRSALTSSGVTLAQIMWFINVALPTIRKFVGDWLPKVEEKKAVGFAANE